MTATHEVHRNKTAIRLHLAFELGWSQWKLAFTIGHGQPARLRTIAARDLERLLHEIARAKRRFDLPEDGAPLGADLQQRMLREFARWQLADQQIRDLENESDRCCTWLFARGAAGQRGPPVPGFDESLVSEITFRCSGKHTCRPRIEGRCKPLIWFAACQAKPPVRERRAVVPGMEVSRQKSALIDALR
jgi:hypothetical protein